MKIILHVGVHKTGTSALQGLLHTNRERLRRQGVWYDPPEGEKNHSSRVFHFRPGETYSPTVFRDSLTEIAGRGCPVYLMSSEVFLERPFDMEAFARSIEGFETEVIAYLRASDDLIVSAYNQLVRTNGWTLPIQAELPYDPSYRILWPWIRDPWKVTLAPYDPKQWPDENIFLDFLSMLKVSTAGMDIVASQEDANRSLPAPLIEVMRAANIVGISGEQRALLLTALHELHRARPDLYPDGELLTAVERRDYRLMFTEYADACRPFYRPGFDERFLLPS
ncbi:hypothetical protein [Mangrovicella endophytica]|uniref:hypothetical protein n=1 Tax=Mangrovicella endophytica TaxID=2066697 RepID=UPI000C9E4D68|nr:hypothetical protein [Mangrovicella endophytica]